MEKKQVRVHRKGQVYVESGNALEWKSNRPFRIEQAVQERLQFLKHGDPVAFRELAASITVELVRYLIARDKQPIELSRVYQQGAYLLDLSPETIKRYIFTHTAEGAELMMAGKRVTVNPFFGQDEDGGEEAGDEE